MRHLLFYFWLLILAWQCACKAGTDSLPAAAAPGLLGWPQFRGPRGDGTAPGANPPVVWNESTNVAWKVAVPGRGRSSPICLGDRIWLTTAILKDVVRKQIGPDDMQTAEHADLLAICLDRATGRPLWETALFAVPHPAPVHWLNSWATPTPVAEPGRVYCDFGAFGTAALDAATGEVLWKQQFRVDHQVGPGSSLVLWKDRLFLVRDGRDSQFVTALDKQTGQVLWKTDRPTLQAASTDFKKSFSTPLVIEQAGPQVVIPGPQWAVAYDPFNGREIWRIRHGQGFSFGTRPVFANNLVYFGTGCFQAQLWAARPDGHGDVTQSNVVWKSTRQVPVMSSPVVSGNEIYWVSEDGTATCADALTGELRWHERLGGPCSASPILAQGRLYFFRRDAKTIVVKAGTQFERLAENALEGTLISTPAVGDRALYLRTDTHLYCLGTADWTGERSATSTVPNR